MKRVLSTILLMLLIFTMTACSVPGGNALCQHRDVNDDGLCDKCDTNYTDGKDLTDLCQHRDIDDNSFCDKCGESYTDGKDLIDICQHRDIDDNSFCDKCGESYTDGKDVFTPCQHRDANDDEKCDKCAENYKDGIDNFVCLHIDANGDLRCDVCGAAVECTNHVDKNHNQRCDYCNAVVPCEHELDEDGFCCWCDYVKCMKHIDRDHDLVCDNAGCDEAVPCTKHADANADAKCDWCQATYSCPLAEHADNNQDGRCDECLYATEFFDFPWSSGTLTFEMTDHSNGQELPSGCKNWMAGETSGTASMTEQATIKRNETAYNATKLKVKYTYLPDNDSEYAWSKNIDRIHTKQASGIYSDMYCNFVYDLMGASLLGCFANLKTDTADNYFEFYGDDDYGTTVGDSNGYMYEYMESLSIDETKMYLLASDYFIDLIRAYYCVPVNVAMLNDLAADDILDLGRANTVTDFADAVLDGKWTYDLLLKYCAKYGDASVDSDKKGFALAEHSLSAAGLLYTSSVRFFTDERKEAGNTFIPDGENSPYHYSEYNQKFMDLAVALEQMVTSAGVVRFTKIDTGGLFTNLLHIREQFTNHRVLFGGVILLGSLEYQDYQNMITGDGEGFMVVPVPLYTDYNVETNDVYNTQIHNVGRIGAISVKTTMFAECSAFLNYQSTHSRNVRETYYNYDLLYSVVGGDSADILEANKNMLNLMRDSVHSGFEKNYEDMSALLSAKEIVMTPGGQVMFSTLKWHDILDRAHYADVNIIRTYYDMLKDAKEFYMGRLFNSGYTMLPA